jgi:radical SAM superfamily enzyme YgiQ (UPF0313 family)
VNKAWVKVDETAMLLQKIQKAGIAPATEMIIGTDGDTIESIQATAKFIIDNKIPAPKFYVLTPLPGTDFYKQIKAQGRLLHEDYKQYTAVNCVFQPEKMTPKELDDAFMNLYKEVYKYKNIFKRNILNKGILKNPLVYLFTFFGNLVYKKSIHQGDAPNIL